jgi:hypothetical protein
MEPTTEQVTRFLKLFRGRGDVYGGEEGACIKQPLTLEVFTDHLAGRNPIGVYPMVPIKDDWYTVWGCSDFDLDNMHDAIAVRESLAAAGVVGIIEKSRSKGYHLWVFATEPVVARDMRRMFLAAHQVADIPAIEVNPKQEKLSSTMQYGNYVRLPYPNFSDLETNKRRAITDTQEPYGFDEFMDMAEANLVTPETVARLANYYKPPQPVHAINTDYVQCESLADAMKPLSPLGKVIWRDGPLPNNDRSRTLAKLGHECVRSGLNPSQTRVILGDADMRWGKYHMRTNGELELDKLVQRVYS